MKFASITALVLAAAASSCGGPSGSSTPKSSTPIPVGIHGCHFVVDGTAYGQHRCDVVVGDALHLDKLSGMEVFAGTLEAIDGVLRLSADMACAAGVEECMQPFTADLKRDGGTWKGQVTSTGGDPAWWLNNSTFELEDAAGYGGATYGAAP
jgi:hypothetical protein